MVWKTTLENYAASKLTLGFFIPKKGKGKTTVISVELDVDSTLNLHPFHAENPLCAHTLTYPMGIHAIACMAQIFPTQILKSVVWKTCWQVGRVSNPRHKRYNHKISLRLVPTNYMMIPLFFPLLDLEKLLLFIKTISFI